MSQHALRIRTLAPVCLAAALAGTRLHAQTPTPASLSAGAGASTPTAAGQSPSAALMPWMLSPPEFRAADSVALTSPDAAAQSLEGLAHDLTKDLHTDREKIRAIYRWVTQNIAYDVGAMGNAVTLMRQDPGAVLVRRKAVCDGYTFLVGTLARMAGMEAELVSGHAKGLGVDDGELGGSHSWDAVKVDGEWKLVDATWGAGDIIAGRFVRRFRDFFFLADPQALIWTHYPADSRWQLLPAPVSAGEFRHQPMPQRDFFALGFDPAAVRATAAAPGFRGFVGVFPIDEHPIRLVQGPLSKDLSPDSTYTMVLDAPGSLDMTLVTGGKWVPFQRVGVRYTVQFTPLPGAAPVVMVRFPGDAQPRVILGYADIPLPGQARRR
jgi:hypothetical protein